jgi:hypothetical protein
LVDDLRQRVHRAKRKANACAKLDFHVAETSRIYPLGGAACPVRSLGVGTAAIPRSDVPGSIELIVHNHHLEGMSSRRACRGFPGKLVEGFATSATLRGFFALACKSFRAISADSDPGSCDLSPFCRLMTYHYFRDVSPQKWALSHGPHHLIKNAFL